MTKVSGRSIRNAKKEAGSLKGMKEINNKPVAQLSSEKENIQFPHLDKVLLQREKKLTSDFTSKEMRISKLKQNSTKISQVLGKSTRQVITSIIDNMFK